MKLINFKVSNDNIGIETTENLYIDLHNNYDLENFSYRFGERYLELNWKRRKGAWVSKEDLNKLKLEFINVQIFRLKEIDQNQESLVDFQEDDKTYFNNRLYKQRR